MRNSFFLILALLLCACASKEDIKVDFELSCDPSSEEANSLKEIISDFTIEQDKTGVFVFEEGEDALVSRGWLCQKAVESIDIQYFIFSVDNIGIIAIDYLIRAANKGIKVRILIDDLMLDVFPDHILAFAKHPNVEIKIYNPNINTGKNILDKIGVLTSDFKGINQRMHHKTFIVDQNTVITGGRNIADEYFDFHHEYNFRDRDVLLVGGVSQKVQKDFNTFWEDDLSVDIEELLSFSKKDYDIAKLYKWVNNYACQDSNFWPIIRNKIENHTPVFQDKICKEMLRSVGTVEYISDIPGKNDKYKDLEGSGNTTERLIELVNSAKKTIYIQTPYLVATKLSQTLFKKAVDRGVEVHILTNSLSSTDNLEAFSGYQRNREDLLETGVNIYEYKPDAAIRKRLITSGLQKELDFIPIFGLHAKSIVVDEEITVIGTFNLDPRSAHLNTECLTVIHSPIISHDVLHIMKEELLPENAWKTTREFNPDKFAGKKKRFKSWTRKIIPEKIL